jgi:hypothetical protein
VSDNPLEPGPQDYDRIHVDVESDIAYWTEVFGVSREHLARVIEEVGPGVIDVKKKLGLEEATAAVQAHPTIPPST